MSDLPKGWIEKKLGEICNITSSKRIFQREYTQSGIPFYRTKEIRELANGKDVTTELFISEEKYKEIKVNFGIPIEEDMLLTAIGTIGEIYIVEKDKEFYFKDGNVLWLKNFKSVSTYYLKYALGSFIEEIKKLSNGSTYNALPIEKLKNHKISLPPLEEQRRIAEVLDRAEELRSKRREAIAQLDTLTQSIFLEMFGDPVVNPFKFPFLPLENVISRSFQNGAYFPKEAYCNEGGVEMIHMSDAFEGIVKRGNLKRVVCSQQDIERYKLSNTDLIVARRSLNYEGSVKPCLIPSSNEPLIFESSLIRITPNPEKVKILYLFYYILNPHVRERFIFPFVTQSTISGINQGNLAKVLLMLPPIDLQNEFAHRVEAVEKLKIPHRASLSELDALFASLQHRAFRGEL